MFACGSRQGCFESLKLGGVIKCCSASQSCCHYPEFLSHVRNVLCERLLERLSFLIEFCPCRIILSLVIFLEAVGYNLIIRSLFLLRGNYISLFLQIQSPRILLCLTVMKQEVLTIPHTRLQEAAVLGLL